MDTTNDKNEISSIIRNCDKAFAEPVAERYIYFDLLQKIHQKGIFVFAYQGKKDIGYCALYANDSDTKMPTLVCLQFAQSIKICILENRY